MKILFMASFLVVSSAVATTNGLSITFNTTAPGGDQKPQNVVVAWITTTNGVFVRTISRWAGIRANDLLAWAAASGGSASDSDAVMGATRPNHSIPSPVTGYWNLKNKSGAVVADDTYNINFEICDDSGGALRKTYSTSFVKGGTPTTNNPAGTTWFTTINAVYIPLSQPQVTLSVNSPFGGASPGTTTTNSGTLISAYVTNSPLIGGGTQLVCTGGTVLSNAFSQVSATNVTLTLTNNALLTWRWTTNYWLVTTTNGSGSVSVAPAWQGIGSNVTVTATPGPNWHFVSWSGDTNGCVMVGNVITALMTQARSNVANFAIDQKTLTVSSAYGSAAPGTLTTNYGTAVSEWLANSPALNGATTQFVCTGASVAGNSFTLPMLTNATLTLTNNATLTWQWTTNYWLVTTTNGSGSVNAAPAWQGIGSNVTVTATPSPNWHFVSWSGDTNGCVMVGNVITALMTQARSNMANFAIDQKTLTVSSAYGSAAPGTLTTNYGTSVSEWMVSSPVVNGSTQYVCSGAQVLGNSFTQVNATNITLTLTNSATVIWQWQTNYWGAPQSWYQQYGFTSNFAAVATNDPNHTGFTVWQDYIADTNPTNPADFFHVVAVSNLPPLRVYFASSSTGRVYTLSWTTNLVSGPWIIAVSNEYGHGGSDAMSDTNAVSGARFYKLSVSLP